MAAGKGEDTALGTAHGRFVESLPRKAIELRGAIALLTATPAAEGPREDMRRRLHTLYASAVVFRNEALTTAVKEGIERLDAARDEARALSAADLEVLAKLIRRIPELRGDSSTTSAEGAGPTSLAPAAASASLAPGAREPNGETPASPREQSGDFVVSRPVLPSAAARTATAERSGGSAPRRTPSVSSLRPVTSSAAPPASPANSALHPESAPRSSFVPAAPLSLTAGERRPLLQRVLSVLVLASPGERKALAELLQSECIEPTFVDSARHALESARDSAPDVIVADEALAVGAKLLEGLRSDPLTDFVPVVVLVSTPGDARASTPPTWTSEGADVRLGRPFESARLLRALGRITGTLVETTSGLVSMGDATVGEVAERVADEIRRGLVEATEAGREIRIPLGEGAEVLAAAWAAIARVRAFVSEQSAGRVRFSELPSRSAPALLSVGQRSGDEATEQGAPGELSGRRILVVDDDASVVEFFASILLEQGATVVTVQRGEDALQAARRERPDLVICDVLMPDLDGFALCRRLKRDPVLADVPVILISWKEDLLARMRELSAGASGYLKKEASWQQVVGAVRDALAARAQLEEQLTGSAEVRGNLEGTGVVSLLRSVRRTRPDARVTLRDAWNLFECELREGRLAQLTRTASDGSFVRGEAALPQLLGASAGRYAVTIAQGALKHAFDSSLDEVLTRGALELGSQLDALSFPLLNRVARVVFDEDAYPALVNQSPAVMREVVERLHSGEPPVKLGQRGDIAQATLEAILLDMGRRGAIRGVVGSAGEDLFAEARVARGREQPVELSSPLSMFPARAAEPESPEPQPVIPEPAPSDAAHEPAAEQVVQSPVADPEPIARTSAEAIEAPVRASTPHPVPAPLERRDSVPPGSSSLSAAAPAAGAAAVARAAASAPVRASTSSEPRPLGGSSSDRRPALPAEPVGEVDPASAEARRSRSTLAAWAVALLALFAAAFFAERLLEPQTSTRVEVIGGGPGAAPSDPSPKPAVAVPPEAPAAKPAAETPLAPAKSALVVPEDSGFQIYNGILEPGLLSAPNQGLVVVEASARLAGAELSVDQQRVGTVPAKVPLSEGIHELAIRRGDAVSYRFVSVRPGKTWVLREP